MNSRAYLAGLAAFLLSALPASAAGVFQHSIHTLDGQLFDWSPLEGKVVLFVNVASRCGHTPQYAGLQALYEEFKDKGLVVVGVPSGDFGNQELATAEEILEFCEANYGVTFPLTEKVSIRGENQHPLYATLTEGREEPSWNFHKYLVGRDGRVIAGFGSGVRPENEDFRRAILAALEARPD
ncbi:MAG: glutathione peroxidase [Puniceicoccaceae bacterium]|nr:MAG: glutathione peroxidase [Puniceicoccaceae bacterium]